MRIFVILWWGIPGSSPMMVYMVFLDGDTITSPTCSSHSRAMEPISLTSTPPGVFRGGTLLKPPIGVWGGNHKCVGNTHHIHNTTPGGEK